MAVAGGLWQLVVAVAVGSSSYYSGWFYALSVFNAFFWLLHFLPIFGIYKNTIRLFSGVHILKITCAIAK